MHECKYFPNGSVVLCIWFLLALGPPQEHVATL